MPVRLKNDKRYTGKQVTVNGSKFTIKEWSEEFDAHYNGIIEEYITLMDESDNFKKATSDQLKDLNAKNKKLNLEVLCECITGWDVTILNDSEEEIQAELTPENLALVPVEDRQQLYDLCVKASTLGGKDSNFLSQP